MAAQSPAPSRFTFIPNVHPHILQHRQHKPVKVADLHPSTINGRIAVFLTNAVGTMWCAYIFAILALLVLPEAIHGGLLTTVQWISQTFIQLVMLSVIMVGQNILGAASDKRAEDTYKDADATFQEAHQIQQHLEIQDQHLAAQDARLQHIFEALRGAFPEICARIDAELKNATAD